MPRPKQTKEQLAAMRERILDAAMALLQEGGPDAITIRAIAERVGVSHMVLYTYFENRDALLAALRERQRGRSMKRYEELLRRARDGDVRQVLREALSIYARSAHSRPKVYQVLWVLPITSYEPPENQRSRMANHLRHLAQMIQLGIERGQCVPRDSMLAAATAFSIVNGPLILHHNGRLADATLLEAVEAQAIDAAMSYLLLDEATPPRPQPTGVDTSR